MKNLFLIFTLLCLTHLQTKAQNGFIVKESGPNSTNLPQDFAIKPNGNILFMFTSISQGTSLNVNEIHELNPSGEIVNIYTFSDSTYDFIEYTQCLIVDDTLYVFGMGYRIIGGNTNLPFLYMRKLDLQLNLISMHDIWLEQISPSTIHHGRIKYINESFHYICGFGPLGNLRTFHAEISKQGEPIIFNIEGEAGKTLLPYDFSFKDDGGFQTYSLAAGYIGPYEMCGFICSYNQDFQIEYYFELPYLFTLFFNYEKENDSIYYLSGQWIDQNASPPWHTGILKMINDTVVVDEFIYLTYPDTTACPAYYNSIEVLPDGNLIFCFIDNVVNNFYPQSEPAQINLMKLTPDFEVIWHRYIGEPGTKYDPYVMRTTESGEIVILGAYSHAPPGNAFEMQALFIKTNSEGIITGTNDELPGVRSTQAIVYPNPARNFVQVEYSMAFTQTTFSLLDISGKTVFEKQLAANKQSLDISGIPAGTYIYRVYNQKGLDESGKLMVE